MKYVKYDKDQACEKIIKFLKILFPEINKSVGFGSTEKTQNLKG